MYPTRKTKDLNMKKVLEHAMDYSVRMSDRFCPQTLLFVDRALVFSEIREES